MQRLSKENVSIIKKKKSVYRSILQAQTHGNGKDILLLEITMSSGNSFHYFP